MKGRVKRQPITKRKDIHFGKWQKISSFVGCCQEVCAGDKEGEGKKEDEIQGGRDRK